jgi:DNA polymerase III epsilon subunit family exonuclease
VLTWAEALRAQSSVGEIVPDDATFTVVDVETTGLDPFCSRVVECAIVTCSADGEILDEWTSLIAPPVGIEIGASWLHGITRQSLAPAPSFADVAYEIAGRLRETIVVGHVVAFDLAHLRAEFHRVGIAFPDLSAATMCTREIARACLSPGSRTLAALCARLGVARRGAHTALGDALATAALLSVFLARGFGIDWDGTLANAREITWPSYLNTMPFCSRAVTRPRVLATTADYADF